VSRETHAEPDHVVAASPEDRVDQQLGEILIIG